MSSMEFGGNFSLRQCAPLFCRGSPSTPQDDHCSDEAYELDGCVNESDDDGPRWDVVAKYTDGAHSVVCDA